MEIQPIKDKPTMQVVDGRPIKTQMHLSSIDGVYVQCRLPDGQDAHVPLREIFEQFDKELMNKVRRNVGMKGDK